MSYRVKIFSIWMRVALRMICREHMVIQQKENDVMEKRIGILGERRMSL